MSASTRDSASHRKQAWSIVAAREVVVKLTDRNFIVSTLATLAIIVGALLFQGAVAAREQTATVAVTAPEAGQLVQAAGNSAGSAAGNVSGALRAVTYADDAAARGAVVDDSADAYLHRAPGGAGTEWVLSVKSEPSPAVVGPLSEMIRADALQRNAAAAKVSVSALLQGGQLHTERLDQGTDEVSRIIRFLAGVVFATLFYLAALLFGMGIAQSVVEEKQSRIVEILASAIPLRQLLLGKVVGNTLLALAQIVLFVGTGLAVASFTQYKTYLPGLSGPVLWYLVFFVAGFITLACVWAVAGSLASRVEDLQSTTMPLTFVLIVVFFGGLSASGAALVVLSYLPLLSTITMPLRLLAGEAAWWEPVLSLLVTVAAAWFIVRIAEKLYRRSLLQSHGRVTVRQALRAQD